MPNLVLDHHRRHRSRLSSFKASTVTVMVRLALRVWGSPP